MNEGKGSGGNTEKSCGKNEVSLLDKSLYSQGLRGGGSGRGGAKKDYKRSFMTRGGVCSKLVEKHGRKGKVKQ